MSTIPSENLHIRPSNNIPTISHEPKEGEKVKNVFNSIFPGQQSATTEDEFRFTASKVLTIASNFEAEISVSEEDKIYLRSFVNKLIAQYIATGELPPENLGKVGSNGTVVKVEDCENVDGEEFKNAPNVVVASVSLPKKGMGGESKKIDIFVPTSEHSRSVLKSNPNTIIMNVSEEMQAQIEQIVQSSVEKYVAYRLSLVQQEKEKESDTHVRNHLSSSPQLYLQNAEEKNPVKPPENKLLMFNRAPLMQWIITINDILTARREEAKTEEIQKEIDEKKSVIVENEIEKQIRKSEIVKGTVQESEIRKSELQK